MTLRGQAQWLVLVVFGALFLVLMLLLHFGLTRAIISLDHKEADNALQNAQQLLDSQSTALLVSVHDYAGWDDTYGFMQDLNKEFISSNLEFSTLQNLNVDSMTFVAMDGSIRHSVQFSENGQVLPEVPDLRRFLRLPDPDKRDWSAEKGTSGVELMDGQFALYASFPVVPTSLSGPARGVLVMTRRLREAEFRQFETILGLPLQLQRLDEKLPDCCASLMTRTPTDRSQVCMKHSKIRAMALLRNPDDQAVGVISISKSGEYSRLATSYELYLALILLSALALFAGAAGRLVNSRLIQPMSSLKESIAHVGDSADPGQRVEIPHHTELAALAESFNNALDRLQSSQAQLADTQSVHKRLYNNTPVMMCEVDREGRVKTANDFLLQSLGYKAEDVHGQPLVDFMSPSSRQAALSELMPEFFSSGTCRQGEFQLLRADGSSIDALFHCVAERNADGKIVGALAMMSDISQLRRAQAEIERYAAEMRAITGAFPDLYFKMDMDGHFLQAIGGTGSFGNPGVLEGRHYSEINTPQASSKIAAAFDQIARGESAEPIEYQLSLNGSTRHFEARFQLLLDGNVLVIIRDISVRRQAQQDLLASEERYRTLVEMAQEGIAQVDQDEMIVFANPAYARALGYEQHELEGTKVWDYLDDDGREIILRRNLERRRGVSSSYELRMRTKSGDYRDFLINATPLMDPGGGYLGAFAVNTDITELKRTQQALASSQRLESLGVLAGGIAHDFNNLLSGIMGNAALAADEAPEHSRLSHHLADILAASRRAADLTRQILTYAGKGRLNIQRFDANAEIRQMARLIEAAIPKGVTVNYMLSPEQIFIEADQAQFNQIVMNLVINAAEAVDPASGQVQIKSSSAQLKGEELSSAQTSWELSGGRYLVLEVIDNGCGMDEATQAKVFEPFFTTKFTGRGLGLAAVLGIIRAHEGALHLSSASGQGTRFSVFMPQECDQSAESDLPHTERIEGSFHGKVLVVDDEPMVLNLADTVLSREGYRVVRATEGTAAVEQFRAAPADYLLVLLDMTMPGMNGAEAFDQLRRIRGDVPVVLCSGYGEDELHRRFSHLEPDAFIQKPYMPDELLSTVSSSIMRHQERSLTS